MKQALSATDYRWEEQGNAHHGWTSLMFGEPPYEAKFFNHTALKVAVEELSEADRQLYLANQQ